MADPKKGTGKKPKGSGRRLYTDENPKTLLVLNLQHQRMQRILWLRYVELINLMLERFKSSRSWNNVQKLWGRIKS